MKINSILNPVQNNKQGNVKIRICELEDYLKKGFHIIGKRMELLCYHICPDEHDPSRIGIDVYFVSECRHLYVELVEDYVPFLVVSTSLPVGPIFDLSAEISMEERKFISFY
ncbi:146_t:CDS:1, partial [Cetraspora pellucida]